MADRGDTRHTQATQLATVVVITTVVLNVLFYVLSNLYFEDRAAMYGMASDDHIRGVRIAFGYFTGSVAIATVCAVIAPRAIGHGLGAAAGLLALVGAYGATAKDMHPVLPATLLVVGLLVPVLVWQSLVRSRAAWSFLIAICAVLGIVTLFGATKVRTAAGIGLWDALIIPGLLAVATAALAMTRDAYRQPERA